MAYWVLSHATSPIMVDGRMGAISGSYRASDFHSESTNRCRVESSRHSLDESKAAEEARSSEETHLAHATVEAAFDHLSRDLSA